jgi:sugar lactone lactonase YvrE
MSSPFTRQFLRILSMLAELLLSVMTVMWLVSCGFSQVQSGTTSPPMQVATPVFNPPGGVYQGSQSVSISDATSGSTIYYTTDGSTPTTSSSKYTGPIAVSQTTTVEAMATASGMTNSAVASASYTIQQQVAMPTFSPNGGTYSSAQTVTISDATTGASIYYTTNGNTATTSSTVYGGPITVSSTETISAIATATGYSTSADTSAVYTITSPPPNVDVTVTDNSGIASFPAENVQVNVVDGPSGQPVCCINTTLFQDGQQYSVELLDPRTHYAPMGAVLSTGNAKTAGALQPFHSIATQNSGSSVFNLELTASSLNANATQSSLVLPACSPTSPFTSHTIINCGIIPACTSPCSQYVNGLSQLQLYALVPVDAWSQVCQLNSGPASEVTVSTCIALPTSVVGVSLGELKVETTKKLTDDLLTSVGGVAFDVVAPEIKIPADIVRAVDFLGMIGDILTVPQDVSEALSIVNYENRGYTSDQCFAIVTVVGQRGGQFTGYSAVVVEPVQLPANPPVANTGTITVSPTPAHTITISPIGLRFPGSMSAPTTQTVPAGTYVVTGVAPGLVPAGVTVQVSAGTNSVVTLPLNQPGFYVANAPTGGPFSLEAYGVTASGDVPPITSISSSSLNTPSALAIDQTGDFWVANYSPSPGSVVEFAAGSSGTVIPTLTIQGAQTRLNGPTGLKFDSAGNLYVANAGGTVAMYSAASRNGLSGVQNLAPTASISGSQTGLTFPQGDPSGIALDSNGNIYVTNGGNPGLGGYNVEMFGPIANLQGNQNESPLAVLSGGNTGLQLPAGIALDTDGSMWVASQVNTTVAKFPPLVGKTGNQNISPTIAISGPSTQLANPYGVVLYPTGELYVMNPQSSTITIYTQAAIGTCPQGGTCNLAPSRVISGPGTGLVQPGGAVGIYPGLLP